MSTIVTDHGNMTHLIMIIQKVMEGSLRFELIRPISDRNPIARPQGSGYPRQPHPSKPCPPPGLGRELTHAYQMHVDHTIRGHHFLTKILLALHLVHLRLLPYRILTRTRLASPGT